MLVMAEVAVCFGAIVPRVVRISRLHLGSLLRYCLGVMAGQTLIHLNRLKLLAISMALAATHAAQRMDVMAWDLAEQ